MIADIVIGIGGLFLVALPLILIYSVKHEDPMQVFDVLTEEELNETTRSYLDDGLIQIFTEEVQDDNNDAAGTK